MDFDELSVQMNNPSVVRLENLTDELNDSLKFRWLSSSRRIIRLQYKNDHLYLLKQSNLNVLFSKSLENISR